MKIETQRLFFALWPDQAVRRELRRIQSGFSGGRPTHVADLHVTLVFLGAVSAERYGCVTEVADGITGNSFSLEIDRVGYWKRPRILWCGPTATPAPLAALVNSLQAGLEGCGFPPERRAFAPHVTLARKARPVDPRALERPLVWRATGFALVSSNSGPAPPLYSVVKKWPLER